MGWKIGKGAHLEVSSLNSIAAVFVEMDTELFCEHIEVLEFGVPLVVSEQEKNSSGVYPLYDGLRR